MSSRRSVLRSVGSGRLYRDTAAPFLLYPSKINLTSRLSEKSCRSFTTIVCKERMPSLASHRALSRSGMLASLNTSVFPVQHGDINMTRHYNSSLTSESNSSSENWEDWFGVEYENPWLGFQPLDDPVLDKSTRYLIEQLQDLYHGIVKNLDRPTTEQCNKVSHTHTSAPCCGRIAHMSHNALVPAT
jgi:hypothetical protein